MTGRAMKVAVLEGDFVALFDLGLPFSVSYQLHAGEGFETPRCLVDYKKIVLCRVSKIFHLEPYTCDN
jgi:hypothetical protein